MLYLASSTDVPHLNASPGQVIGSCDVSPDLGVAMDFSNLFHGGFLQGELLDATWDWLQEQSPYIVRYNEAWRVPVKSRPRINWGLKHSDGYWPLYKWGQIAEGYDRIEDMPPQIQRVAEAIEQRFGHPPGYLNSALGTFYANGGDHFYRNPSRQRRLARPNADLQSKLRCSTPVSHLRPQIHGPERPRQTYSAARISDAPRRHDRTTAHRESGLHALRPPGQRRDKLAYLARIPTVNEALDTRSALRLRIFHRR